MAQGGIYDHLGGGFYRYSVDEKWMIPHFEKMLYDNALLLALYSSLWQTTKNPLFKKITEETGAWVMREMQSSEGGYFSTLDADSEGEEGKFYLWTPEEARHLLTPEEYAVFAAQFGLDRTANFEGHWHLYSYMDSDTIARNTDTALETVQSRLDSARSKLFKAREQRVRPGRDEKILSAWNGLMIKGMATAGRLLDRRDFLLSAEKALDFVRTTMWQNDRLLANYKDQKAHLGAYLDDYAFLIDGILELLQARWRDVDFRFALALSEVLLKHFQDTRKGGFYFTADDHEHLIQRPKPLYDEALPSGNGITVQVFIKLGHLLSSMPYLVAAERTLKWAWPTLEQMPTACTALLTALEDYFHSTQIVILRGQLDAITTWQKHCTRDYVPRRLTLAIPSNAGPSPGILAQYQASNIPIAYVCSGTQCSSPITSLEALEKQLAGTEIIDP
jgi:uncharacterized protein YyaL (SSP411 family)